MHHLQQLFLLSSLLIVLILISAAMAAAAAAMAKPGCQDRCGKISVPYPFGIVSKDCYFDESFKLDCNHSVHPPVLYYRGNGKNQILQLITVDYVRILSPETGNCYNKSTGENPWLLSFGYPEMSPFTYSTTRNKFTAIGCDFFAYIPVFDLFSPNSYKTGCASFCNNETFEKHNKISSCLGNNGCCQTSISKELYDGFDRLLHSAGDIPIKPFDRLLQSAGDIPIKPLAGKNYEYLATNESINVPVIMDWAIGNKTCKEARGKIFSSSYVCGSNSVCVNSKNGRGYKCKCSPGYRGNPYLLHGCQYFDECKESNGRVCPNDTRCLNKPWGYTCEHINTKLPVSVVIPIGIGSGIIFVFLLVLGFWFWIKHRPTRFLLRTP